VNFMKLKAPTCRGGGGSCELVCRVVPYILAFQIMEISGRGLDSRKGRGGS